MSKSLQARRLNMQAFAREGTPLIDTTLLQDLERLAQDAHAPAPDLAIAWQARAELRAGTGTEDDVWLHLVAHGSVPLVCQRCMGTVDTPLTVDQWYRFVATEEIAMAEDDESEEDLLVMAPQFDLLSLLEDELLMALPLVPMHGQCPVAPTMQAGEDALQSDAPAAGEKPNPFAMLAQLKKKND